MTPLSTAANKAREWTARRDALIRQRRADGVTLREIADEAGLSHAGIRRVLAREPVGRAELGSQAPGAPDGTEKGEGV